MVRSKDSRSLLLIAFVLAIAALYFGRQILMPLALGLVFSFLLTPLVTQLEKTHLGRVPAVLIVLGFSVAVMITLSWGVAGQLVEVTAHVSDYKSNLDTKIQSLHAQKDGSLSKATATVKELNRELSAVPGQISANQAQSREPGASRPVRPIPVQVAVPPSNFIQDLRTLLGPLAVVLETTVIVVIFTVFMPAARKDVRIICLPASNGADSLVTTMLTQLLQHEGYDTRQIDAGAIEKMLAPGSRHEHGIVCISSLLLFAIGQTRTLCRRLKATNPNLEIVVGLWGFEGDNEKARERLGMGCPAAVAATLSDALGQIRRMAGSVVSMETFDHDLTSASEKRLDAWPHAESSRQ